MNPKQILQRTVVSIAKPFMAAGYLAALIVMAIMQAFEEWRRR